MKILRRFPDTIAANMARARLSQHGIDASVADEVMANLYWPITFASGGVPLMVQDEDVKTAAAILRSPGEDVLLAEDAGLVGERGLTECEVSGPSQIGDFFRLRVPWIPFILLSAILLVWLLWLLLKSS